MFKLEWGTSSCFINYSPFYNVDVPKLNTIVIHTPTFEWYMAWCSSKHGYQKDICLREI